MKPQKDAQPAVKGPKLILHFDINKTICLYDKNNDMTKEQTLCDVLSSYCWGKIEQKDPASPPLWKLTHYTFSINPPAEGLINYKTFIESQFPRKTKSDEPNVEIRTEHNRKIKAENRLFYYEFFKPGKPGAKLHKEFDKLLKTMTLPKVVLDELGITGKADGDAPGIGKDELSELFSDGKYFILPSFFRTMLMLKKAKRDFGIVFRTFGTDSVQIKKEYNRFCEGTHPCYNGKNNFPLARFDGSKNSRNFILDDSHMGLVHRSSNMNEMVLVTGTAKRNKVESGQSVEDAYAKDIADGKVIKTVRGFTNVYIRMNEMLKEKPTMSLNDDYRHWKKYDEKDHAAKLMIIDQYDYNTLQIFFDETVADADSSLVDPRDLMDGSRIPRQAALNKYMVCCDTIKAITDPDYFLKQIEQCELMRADEINRIEKGMIKEVTQEQLKAEWEQFQSLSDQEYLRKAILPLLNPALSLVDIERPDDPLAYIAFYLLKNKDKVPLPQKPRAEPPPVVVDGLGEATSPSVNGQPSQPLAPGQIQSMSQVPGVASSKNIEEMKKDTNAAPAAKKP